jgi:hypothetical protein
MAASISRNMEAKVYKDEVLGRRVEIVFLIDDTDARDSFSGEIRKVQMQLLEDGTIETEHFIIFDDDDERWFDLVTEEEDGRLRWIDDDRKPAASNNRIMPNYVKSEELSPDYVKSEESTPDVVKSQKSTPDVVKSQESTPDIVKSQESSTPKKRAAPAVHVTPENTNKKKRPGIIIPSGGVPEKWMNEMEVWLKEVPHGNSQKVVSVDNARSVMRQVRRLALGEGITYLHWPVGTFFYKDTKVNLSFDFGQMHDEAVRIEDTHGRDKGNGWLLKHPIRKLELYQEYRYGRDSF